MRKLILSILSFSRKNEKKVIRWCNRVTILIGLYLFMEKYILLENESNIIVIAWTAFWQIKTLVIIIIEFLVKWPLYYLLNLNPKKSAISALPWIGPMYTY